MTTYRIYKKDWSAFINFSTPQEAEQYAKQLGNGYYVEEAGEEMQLSQETRLELDINFGTALIREFTLDNRAIKISLEDSVLLLKKFADIKSLCEIGAIKDAYTILSITQTDSIFTQKRKDKYLKKIKQYLDGIY